MSLMTNSPFTGGCQCGAIRFSTTELIDNAHICHCRMCQKAVGNLFAALVSAPKEALTWTRGVPGRFQSSENVERGFCSQCGTPLFYDSLNSDEIGLCIGAFDAPQSFVPLSHDSTESRLPWFSEITAIRDAGTSEEIDGPGRVEAIKATNRQHPDHDTAVWPLKQA
jgi:hypothetical protein